MMEQLTLIGARRTFERTPAREDHVRARADAARVEKDEYAFTRGMLVGLPLSLGLWAILAGIAYLLL